MTKLEQLQADVDKLHSAILQCLRRGVRRAIANNTDVSEFGDYWYGTYQIDVNVYFDEEYNCLKVGAYGTHKDEDGKYFTDCTDVLYESNLFTFLGDKNEMLTLFFLSVQSALQQSNVDEPLTETAHYYGHQKVGTIYARIPNAVFPEVTNTMRTIRVKDGIVSEVQS